MGESLPLKIQLSANLVCQFYIDTEYHLCFKMFQAGTFDVCMLQCSREFFNWGSVEAKNPQTVKRQFIVQFIWSI